ncbi:hypothetical protein TVAG_132190 [Trichomonas vaginalis G3]|uniref:Uncharacterized protein n=1 Tax=Trichomonas vaginalis (strain ATCC PRA-98 / G3) TaxID=412133 RepID=A2FNK2_TRIV3|nr:hypothetical protein TVAGG3_0735820 [Trichomonas vaginalis G3]EAX93502.1 hypothetical protein TVAG_132190 [Trichomonas vaginalis G3]KAI5511575.1 hypothetical protein TVAGG3_0735820 [Trichomonas vaginalis G3]|eukprot:XP_001306432.1 hypothetical protein [Trichomonas vaginalis G3]
MSHFDADHRLQFPPSLANLIDNYEKHDTPLFEPISFRHISTPTHNFVNSPRKKNDSLKSKSILHISSNNAPLPSLPSDSETKNLRESISMLEHQLIDSESEIKELRDDISKLQQEISLLRGSERMSRDSQPKFVHTPTSNRARTRTPPELSGNKLAEYYKSQYEAIQNKLDNLQKVLSNNRKTTSSSKSRK